MIKVILITLVFCLVFSVGASSRFVVDFNYTSFQGTSYIYSGIKVNPIDELSFMIAGNTISTFLGSISAFDVLGGFNFEFKPLLSNHPTESTLMGGLRIGKYNKGYLIKLISTTNYTEKIFLFSDVEFVIWPEGDSTVKNKIFLGYRVVEELSLLGGLNNIIFSGLSEWGLSFGLRSNF